MAFSTHGHTTELRPDECWDLLSTTEIGRIAWTTAYGPVVVPVNFATDGRDLYIRTRAYSALVQKADAERVAFEVDRIDEGTHAGWSVLVRGRAEVRYGENAGGPVPDPWPLGPRSATVVITVDEVTGRRLAR